MANVAFDCEDVVYLYICGESLFVSSVNIQVTNMKQIMVFMP